MHYHTPDLGEERPLPKDGEVIVFTDHMNWGFSPPNSKFFRMFCTSSNSIRKTLDPTPCQTFVTFKFSVKYTFKKSLVSSFSGNSSIWTAKMSSQMGPAWNLVESRFNAEETPFSLMHSCRVTPKTRIKHCSTLKISCRLMKIHCRVIVLNVLTQVINSLRNLPPPNARNSSLQSEKSKPC